MLENEAGGPPGQRNFSPDQDDPAEVGALASLEKRKQCRGVTKRKSGRLSVCLACPASCCLACQPIRLLSLPTPPNPTCPHPPLPACRLVHWQHLCGSWPCSAGTTTPTWQTAPAVSLTWRRQSAPARVPPPLLEPQWGRCQLGAPLLSWPHCTALQLAASGRPPCPPGGGRPAPVSAAAAAGAAGGASLCC